MAGPADSPRIPASAMVGRMRCAAADCRSDWGSVAEPCAGVHGAVAVGDGVRVGSGVGSGVAAGEAREGVGDDDVVGLTDAAATVADGVGHG